MNKEQAIKFIKAAFETVKQAASTDDEVKKNSLLFALEAFSDHFDAAIKVLEEGAE